MFERRASCIFACLLTACVSQESSDAASGSTQAEASAGDSEEAGELEAGASQESTETETETETGTTGESVEVRWMEVSASDYKLELVPEFDAAVTEYLALSEGPDITVYVDVNVDADVEGVLVNDVPAALNGFRTWRSAPETELVSPTSFVVEVQAGELSPPTYSFEITVP